MRAVKDFAIFAALQLFVSALWLSNKIHERRHGYLWDDERYKLP